ncbi:hypothetical protein K4H96_1394 [Streptococcus sanguinis]|uniref:DUF1803 domain-containing protein n=1 Tax=Streptococcus sanguinis TaxID=1305 RepID=UPI001CBF6701|nr:DUF1803 domain-containing protein [Streptococcus sanguinis]MBZ2040199.1 DUF1803 domain-containing protein [Streptococcus sanguinis]MCC3170994.1 hypothetical protein [Streptococcus sanguinis]
MIKIINPSRLTRKSFFQELIDYLDQHEGVILRAIKREFAGVANIDRSIEEFIKAGYIRRENKRYYLTLPLLESLEDLRLDQEVFICDDSPLYQDLLELRFKTQLSNQTNAAVLLEETDFLRDKLTLANYFYKMQRQYPLSDAQKPLYAVLGDVNPEYALKYMTTFLLKYVRKAELMQKRRDIFVDSLVILGYIRQNEAGKYELQASFDKERLTFQLD